MPYAFAGKGLEIDLSSGGIEIKATRPDHVRTYLGGRGLATRMFLDRVPPDTAAFAPGNPLIFAAGLLTGTMAPSANRTSLVTRSPQTGLLTYSTIGGFFGPELKLAGYDTLYVEGKAEAPVYLVVRDGRVALENAAHLWGRSVRETRQALAAELGQKRLQMLVIGPAGENRVMAASIEHDMGTGAHRAGVGAVMGSKNLKAIVVCGTRDIHVADPAAFQRTCAAILSKTARIRDYWRHWPSKNGSWLFSEAVHGNYDEVVTVENDVQILSAFEQTFKRGTAGCFNCAAVCKSVIALPEGQVACIKCQSFFNFMFAARIMDVPFGVRCFRRCEDLGLDVISTACLVGFAIDLFQKGIVGTGDTGGVELGWGDREAVLRLIEMIARRQGIGDLLALGVVGAAEAIGKGAGAHAYHVKRLEPIPYTIEPYSALLSAVGDRPDQTRSEGFAPSQGLEHYSAAWRRQYVAEGYFSYPDALRAVFESDYKGQAQDYRDVVPFAVCDIDKNSLADCTGVCIFWTGFWQYNPILVSDHLQLIEHGAGIALDEKGAMDAARRSNAMTRAYNVMTGLRRRDDTVHERFFKAPAGGGRAALDREKFDEMVSRFYRLRGWNEAGVPSAVELDRLGLGDVRVKLEKQGLL